MKIRLSFTLLFTVIILCIISILHQNQTGATTANDASLRGVTSLLAHAVPPINTSHLRTAAPKHKPAKVNPDSLKNTDWASTVMAGLKQKSYHFDTAAGGQVSSINLRQRLKTDYDATGFCISPLQAPEETENSKKQKKTMDEDWQLSLHIQGLYADGRLADRPSVSARQQVADTEVNYRSDGMTVQYQNTEAGVRQNFIIEKAPAANAKELRVTMQASKGWIVNKTNDREVQFAQQEHGALHTKLVYNDLTVWDATGKKLPAHMDAQGSELAIVVAANNAKYPVTIDPLTYGNIPAATLGDPGGGENDMFGSIVASAGDVNGDGYSDVAVTGGGKIYIFDGSSTGLPSSRATPTTTLSIYFSDYYPTQSQISPNSIGTGDVNGDGYSDLIVTARGNAYIFQGSANGLPATPTTILLNSGFSSVATAGDVNGDGYSDVIVTGSTDVYIFQGSAVGLNSTPATTILNSNYPIGTNVATAGDVNGDGYSDVIAGSPYSGLGGVAYLFLGGANGLSATASTTLANPTATSGDEFGYSVATAGDVNGDGYSDVVLGAIQADSGQGRAYVFMGGAIGLTTSPAVMLSGPFHSHSDYKFGWAVASAGDINGDGYSDIIVGEQELPYPPTSGNGLACIYNGSATGIAATPSQILNDPPFQSYSTDSYHPDAFSASIASAGDINGDGYSDIIIGAPYTYLGPPSAQYPGGAARGQAYIYMGVPDNVATALSGTLNGAIAGDQFGISVASAGDVNADGYNDVIVGANLAASGQGKAYLYLGSARGISTTAAAIFSDPGATSNDRFGGGVAGAGDVNGDGYSDVIVGAVGLSPSSVVGKAYIYYGNAGGVATSPSVTISDPGAANADRFGRQVASAGDVNGDGYSDVIVGAFGTLSGHGAAYVYYGSSSGLPSSPSLTLNDPANGTNDGFGNSIATAGDVNGDGYSDVLVYGAGKAYLYYGGPGGLSATAATSVASSGTVGSAGDVNGDGYNDVIIGVSGGANIYQGSANGLSTTATNISGTLATSAGDVNGDGYSDVITNTSAGANIYQGSANGLSATAATTIPYSLNLPGFNIIASAGDVNGDGYSDVIGGNSGTPANPGAAYIVSGNGGYGKHNNMLRLFEADLTTPLRASNNSATQFGIGLFVNPFLGTTTARLVWETEANGAPFQHNISMTNYIGYTDAQTAYTAIPSRGIELRALVNKVGTATRVRVRLQYEKAVLPGGQVFGPWIYPQAYFTGARPYAALSGVAVPVASITTSSLSGTSYCAGASLQVPYVATETYNSGNTFTAQLSDASGSFSSATAIGSVSATASGSISATIPSTLTGGTGYRIRVVSTNPAVTGTDNGTNITLNPVPVISLGTSPQVCKGTASAMLSYSTTQQTLTSYSIDYDAAAEGAGFTDVTDADLPTGQITLGIPSTADVANYHATLTVKNATGCASTPYSFTITVNGLPDAPTVTGNGQGSQTACFDGTTSQTLTASASAPSGTSLLWYTSQTGSATTTTPTQVGAGTVTYWAASQNTATGCASAVRTPVTLTLQAAPAVYAVSGGGSYCAGGSGVTISVSNSDLGVNYTLLNGSTAVVTKEGTGASLSFLNVMEAGTYTIQAVNPATTCSAVTMNGAASISINAQPTASLSGGATYCSGANTTTNLTVNVTGSGTISGTLSDGTPFSGTAPVITIPVSPTATTTYTITTLSDAGCSAQSADLSGSATVTINPTPSAPTSGGDQVQCAQSPLQTLTATATGGTITWYDAATGGNVVTNPTLNAVGTVTYYAQSFNGSCSSATRTAVTLTIHALPMVSFSGLGSSYCANTSPVILTGSPAGGLFSGTGISGNTFDPSAAGAGGPYTITYSYTDGYGCSNTSSQPVMVNAAPSTPVVTVLDNCGSSTLSTTATGSLLWSTGATTSSIVVNTADTYTVTQTVNGCTSTAGAAWASPKLIPSTPAVTVVNSCGTSSLSTTASGSLLWNTGATTPSILVTAGGSYSVTQTVNGCTSQQGSALAAPNAIPSTPAVTVVNNCGSSTLSTTATGNLLWSTGATTPSITINNGGNYTVTQTVNGCISAAGTALASPNAIPAKPTISAGGATTFCSGGSVTLSAPAGYASYKWSNGETTPSITVKQSGSYNVQVTNSSGCTSVASDATVVTVNAAPSTPAVTVLNNCGSSTLSTTATGNLLWNTGATSSSIVVSAAGTYTVTQTVNGCTSASGGGTAAPGTPPAAPIVTVMNSCGSSTLSIPSGGSIVWSTGATTPSITVTAAGTYKVTRTANGCTSLQGSAVAAPKALPVTPTVTVSNSCGTSWLSTTATGSLLWSTGARTPFIIVSSAGTYMVTQTTNGCTSLSGSGVAAPNMAPSVTVSNIAVNSGSASCSALVAVNSYVTVSGSPAPTVVYKMGNTTINPVYSFPVGTSKVNVTASNFCGSTTKSFTVTVTDHVAPVITCKPNTTKTVSGSTYTVLGTEFNATATDNCGMPSLMYSLSGATTAAYKPNNLSLAGVKLNAGATTISWKATDASGNTATCTTVVTVKRSTTYSAVGAAADDKGAATLDNNTVVEKLSVKVMPNPSNSRFTLVIQSSSKEKCTLVVMDEVGRMVEMQHDIAPNSTLQIGSSYRAGMYMAVIMQGKDKVTLKLIKGEGL